MPQATEPGDKYAAVGGQNPTKVRVGLLGAGPGIVAAADEAERPEAVNDDNSLIGSLIGGGHHRRRGGGAPAAHADSGGNADGYLRVLADDGIEFPPAHRDSTVGFGYWICDSMRTFNRSEQQEASQITNVDLVGADPHRVQILVSAAHSQLCPDVP